MAHAPPKVERHKACLRHALGGTQTTTARQHMGGACGSVGGTAGKDPTLAVHSATRVHTVQGRTTHMPLPHKNIT